tara:strand:- start:66 stop:464 length:399 start_codon:yes stop_codon:yes gene_type:complete
MDSLEEKYLKLLAEYEKLEEGHPCFDSLKQCSSAYYRLNDVRKELIKSIESLYSSWIPPKIHSFFSTIKAWCMTGFKKSKFGDRRLEICSSCEYFKDDKLCQLCGCYMKYKAQMAAASCPISKWKPEEDKST